MDELNHSPITYSEKAKAKKNPDLLLKMALTVVITTVISIVVLGVIFKELEYHSGMIFNLGTVSGLVLGIKLNEKQNSG